jgi:glucan 1,3-beta-glucosidase
MHFSTLFTAAVATAPTLVAAGGNMGFALGSKLADGSCKYQADYEADFKAIVAESGSKIVRIYAADQCNTAQQILPAAKSQGFQVVLGVWCVLAREHNWSFQVELANVPDGRHRCQLCWTCH